MQRDCGLRTSLQTHSPRRRLAAAGPAGDAEGLRAIELELGRREIEAGPQEGNCDQQKALKKADKVR